MDQKQIILDILTTPHFAEKLKKCVQNLPHDDPIFTNYLAYIFTRFPVHKPPRGIGQIDILHFMFQFCAPDECLMSFQFVCKSWNCAFESMRFDYMVKKLPEICFSIDPEFDWKKIIEKFQKIDIQAIQINQIDEKDNYGFVYNVLKSTCTNLTEIELPDYGMEDWLIDTDDHLDFCVKILHRSQHTLKKIQGMLLPFFNFGLTFPRVEEISISFFPDDTVDSLHKLISSISNILPSLKFVCFHNSELTHWENEMCKMLCDYLIDNYRDKFLAAHDVDSLDLVPSKYCICDRIFASVENIVQKKFSCDIEYLSISTSYFTHDWKSFEKISKFANLKKIAICVSSKQLCSEPSEILSPELRQVQNLIQHSDIQFVTTEHIKNEFEKEKKNKLIFESRVTICPP